MMPKVAKTWHVRITCPECFTTGKVSQLYLGSKVKCKCCRTLFVAEVKPFHPRKEVEEVAGSILLSPVRSQYTFDFGYEVPDATRCPSCHCEAQFPEDFYRDQVRCPLCSHFYPTPVVQASQSA